MALPAWRRSGLVEPVDEAHGLNTSSVFGPSPALQLPLRAGRYCDVAPPSKNDAW